MMVTKEWSPANFADRAWAAFEFEPATLTYRPLANPGQIVFTSIYGWTSEPLQSKTVLHYLAWDFDSPILTYALEDVCLFVTTLNEVYDVKADEIGIYFSGSKGFHVVIPIAHFTGDTELVGVHPDSIKQVALELGQGFPTFDQSIYDVRRLLRVPNARNLHSGLYKVPMYYEELITLSIEDIRLMARTPRPLLTIGEEGITKSPMLSDLLMRAISVSHDTPTTARSWSTPFPELFLPASPGNRNNAAIALAGLLLGHIRDQQVLQQIMHMWNRTNSQPLPARELTMLVQGAFTRYTTKQTTHTQSKR